MSATPTTKLSKARPQTTVTHRRRNLVMYSLHKLEISILRAGYSSPGLGLFGLFLGIAATCYISCKTVNLPPDISLKFWIASVLCGGLAVICMFWAIRDWYRSKQVLDAVDEETVELVIESPQAITKPPQQ